jgi:hypothetical protein
MVELIRAELATAKGERVVAGARKMEVARVRMTDVGRRAHSPSNYPYPLREQRQ